ncbi:MAG: putative secreted protein [Bradyrhizobium sp.]|nr:putative secreted protein [Bradyrhizobium sp.]
MGTTNLNSLAIDDLTLGGVALTASAAELNRVAQVSARIVAGGAALSVTQALHDSKTVLLDTAAGTTITLPAASGSGARFKFLVSVIATSNSHIVKVANASDTMTGMILSVSDDAGFPVKGYTADATAGADTITLNRTTTGSTVKGEYVFVEDYAVNKWSVTGMIAATGTEATPFSATV